MHTATIDCLLDYEVIVPTHFCFNIEAAFHESHRVLEERLSVTPSVKVRHFCDERNGNRFFRLDAPRGLLSVNYHARAELHHAAVPQHLEEAAGGEVEGERRVVVQPIAVKQDGRRVPVVERQCERYLQMPPTAPKFSPEQRIDLFSRVVEPTLQRELKHKGAANGDGSYSAELIGYVEIVSIG